MPTNDQDARALTYLAQRLRAETHGASKWDEAGTYTAVAKYVGQNLAETVERITRHAADKEARTPGAIHRPFVPDAQPDKWRPNVLPANERCSVCSHAKHATKCPQCAPNDDHTFVAACDVADRKRTPEAMAAIVEDARQRLERTTESSPPPVRTPDPRVDEIRAELHTATPIPASASTHNEES